MKNKITTKNGGYLIEQNHLENYPWVLGLQGSPYEMGYQHGYLLAELIRKTASGFLTPTYAQFGGWQPDSGNAPLMDQVKAGRELLFSVYNRYFEPNLKQQAPDLLEEMDGIADGVREAGTGIPKQDILIGNCIPEITEMVFYLPDSDPTCTENAVESKGCSDCVTWGKATRNGYLLHGTNYDYATFGVLHKGVGVTVVKPNQGNSFLAQCLAGMVGYYRGMNTMGITTGEPTSDSADRDIKNNGRIPHAMHMRKLIQFSNNVRDAIHLMNELKGTTGFNHVVADSKSNEVVDIETSCTKLGVVHPGKELDALWSCNQSVAYPGFNGYEGTNLVLDQLRYWKADVDKVNDIESWQSVARVETDKRSYSWQRFEKLENLVKEHYGSIDVDKMIRILSSWPLSRPVDERVTLVESCDQLYNIHAPIKNMKLASIFSAVFDPQNNTAWIAVGAEPAQAGIYWPINLSDYLNLLQQSPTSETIPDVIYSDGKPGRFKDSS
ncbi:MAG: C45 family peptidase [Proteobacteria bacterium]|nr:C45 family peptidase [Pseudomonadota bacterium]